LARRGGAFLAGLALGLDFFLRATGFRAGAFLRFACAFFLAAMGCLPA
jgi:hypothetical protein